MDVDNVYETKLRSLDQFSFIGVLNGALGETDANEITKFLISANVDSDPDCKRIQKAIESGETVNLPTLQSDIDGEINPRDPDDDLGAKIKHLFKDARIICQFIQTPHFEAFGCIVFPNSKQGIRYKRLDHCFFDRRSFPSITTSNTSHEFSEKADFRALLGCVGFERKTTILAGSPGWEFASSRNSDHINRNNGTLEAVYNDYSSVLGMIQNFKVHGALSDEEIQPSIIRDRSTFLGIIGHRLGLTVEGDDTGQSDGVLLKGSFLENPDGKFANTIFENSVIQSDKIDFNCTNVIFKNSRISPNTDSLVSRSLIRSTHPAICGSQPLNYAMIYYAGHGSLHGDIQIGKDEVISPEELVEISVKATMPLFIVLDMCFSHKFGERFRKCLLEHRQPGIVLCATSSLGDPRAYEDPKAAVLPRIPYAMSHRDKPGDSRGVFTSVLIWAMLEACRIEQETDAAIQVSIADFCLNWLNPMCKVVSENLGLPRQNPVVFSGDI